MNTNEATGEAALFGAAARRLVTGRWRRPGERLRLALILTALLIDAEDPQDARRLMWPWVRQLLDEDVAA